MVVSKCKISSRTLDVISFRLVYCLNIFKLARNAVNDASFDGRKIRGCD
jgi:hypothetical protein